MGRRRGVDEGSRERGDPGEVGEEVDRGSLGAQHRTGGSTHERDPIPRLDCRHNHLVSSHSNYKSRGRHDNCHRRDIQYHGVYLNNRYRMNRHDLNIHILPAHHDMQ